MRVLPEQFITAVTSGVVMPAILVDLTFVSGTKHVWSGVGPLAFNGNTYIGAGTLGSIGPIVESIELQADGTSVALSGIDPSLYAECLSDIQLGLPATIWFCILAGGFAYGYKAFEGQMDKPSINTGADAITIAIALENKLVNLQRPSARRYTTQDQYLDYPNDCGFSWVPMLNDIAIKVR